MGLFSNFIGMINIQKIRNGGTAKLSLSQLSFLLINLQDAKRNLSSEKFNQIFRLFIKMKSYTTKYEMDYDEYLEAAIAVIKKFDAIAPYEKYCGGLEIECSFFMDELRKESQSFDPSINTTNQEVEEYSKLLSEQSNGIIPLNLAKEFSKILFYNSLDNKEKILKDFDLLCADIVNEYGAIPSVKLISFLIGVLNANDIITKSECNDMRDKFVADISKKIIPNQ